MPGPGWSTIRRSPSTRTSSSSRMTSLPASDWIRVPTGAPIRGQPSAKTRSAWATSSTTSTSHRRHNHRSFSAPAPPATSSTHTARSPGPDPPGPAASAGGAALSRIREERPAARGSPSGMDHGVDGLDADRRIAVIAPEARDLTAFELLERRSLRSQGGRDAGKETSVDDCRQLGAGQALGTHVHEQTLQHDDLLSQSARAALQRGSLLVAEIYPGNLRVSRSAPVAS